MDALVVNLSSKLSGMVEPQNQGNAFALCFSLIYVCLMAALWFAFELFPFFVNCKGEVGVVPRAREVVDAASNSKPSNALPIDDESSLLQTHASVAESNAGTPPSTAALPVAAAGLPANHANSNIVEYSRLLEAGRVSSRSTVQTFVRTQLKLLSGDTSAHLGDTLADEVSLTEFSPGGRSASETVHGKNLVVPLLADKLKGPPILQALPSIVRKAMVSKVFVHIGDVDTVTQPNAVAGELVPDLLESDRCLLYTCDVLYKLPSYMSQQLKASSTLKETFVIRSRISPAAEAGPGGEADSSSAHSASQIVSIASELEAS